MTTKTLLQISLRCLKKHKIRTFLTILGIIIGIAAIIATLSIGYGAEEKLRKRILGMGRNYIFIHPGKYQEGKTTLTKRRHAKRLREQDIKILKKQCNGIKKISPVMYARRVISFKGNNVQVDIKCGNEDNLDIVGRKIKKGSFFTKYHVLKSSKVVVIGSKTAKELFGSLNPLGKTIKIQNILFTVIGVVAPIEHYMGIMNPNLDIYMPISTAKKQLLSVCDSYIHGINISAKNKQEMHSIVKRLKKILRFMHRLESNNPDDFTIYDQQAMVKAAKKSSSTLNILLLIIAAISLLVGGIGVMNIMLVSVSERVKEIGIRMALGANSAMILKQFILESIVLCSIGGIIGVTLGLVTPHVVSIFTKWPVVIKIQTIFFAFFITFFIGLIFGYYPARKASKLNPVDALQDN